VFADIDHLLFAAVSQVVAALDGGDIDDLACLAELCGRQRSGGIVCDQLVTVWVTSWGIRSRGGRSRISAVRTARSA
jgi:hypothetical protein